MRWHLGSIIERFIFFKQASKSKKIARTMNSLISIIENKQRKTVNLIYQYKNEIEELDRLISSVQNCVDSSNTRK